MKKKIKEGRKILPSKPRFSKAKTTKKIMSPTMKT